MSVVKGYTNKTTNKIEFYTENKLSSLQKLRTTISLKLQGFEYTFQMFQNQMLRISKPFLPFENYKAILLEYPFFLSEDDVEQFMVECNPDNQKQLSIQIFCKKMRQFIEDYDKMSDEEETLLENKIFKRWSFIKEEALELFAKRSSGSDCIGKDNF